MSEEPQDVAPGGYTWLEIDSPDDYDRLVDILDVEFEPEARCAKRGERIPKKLMSYNR